MARIAILEHSDMNAEQARVYDAAKQSSGIVGGPYYAYIRLKSGGDSRFDWQLFDDLHDSQHVRDRSTG